MSCTFGLFWKASTEACLFIALSRPVTVTAFGNTFCSSSTISWSEQNTISFLPLSRNVLIKSTACAIFPLVAKERSVMNFTSASIRILRRISQSVHSVYSCRYVARSDAARLYSALLDISTYKSTRVLSGSWGSTFAFSRRIMQVS